MTKTKTLTYNEFEAEMLKKDAFHETINTLKWLARDESNNKGMEVGILQHMYKRYIAYNKKFEKASDGRIGRHSTSRF